MAKPKLVYPYPVAIGTFSDGRELRMSIAQEQGRPVDASRAERLLRFAHATNFGPPLVWRRHAAARELDSNDARLQRRNLPRDATGAQIGENANRRPRF